MAFNGTTETFEMSEWDIETILQGDNDANLVNVVPAIVFIGILMVFGVFGNAFVAYVYYFKFKPSTLRCFIIALAVIDTAICAYDIPLRILILRYNYTFGRYRNLCKAFYLGHDSLFLCSMYMLVSVAVERFKKVCMPLQNQMTIFHAKVTVAVCSIFAFLFGLPAVFKYGTKTIRTSVANVTGKQCYRDDDHDLTLVQVNYVFWIITNIGVLGTLIVLYSLIWVKVRKQLKFKKTSSINKKAREAVAAENSSTDNCSTGATKDKHLDRVKRTDSERSTGNNNHKPVSENASDASLVARLARKASAWRIEDRRQKNVQRMTTVMTLVTLVSIFAYLPVVSKMFIQLVDSKSFNGFKKNARWLYIIYVHTYYIQCAANPLIYSYRNSMFRNELKRLFRLKGAEELSSVS